MKPKTNSANLFVVCCFANITGKKQAGKLVTEYHENPMGIEVENYTSVGKFCRKRRT